MALDEYIFGKVMRYFRNRKTVSEADRHTVYLEHLKPRLTILARAITGRAVEIFPAIREGGYKGDSFFLPGKWNWYNNGEANNAFYLFRTLYLSMQQQLGHNWYGAASLSDEAATQYALQHAPQVLEHMFTEYPGSRELFNLLRTEKEADNPETLPEQWLYGKWMAEASSAPEAPPIPALTEDLPEKQIPPTILQARPVEEMVNLAIDTRQQEDYVMTHNFEKVDTAEEFSGSWRDFDGADELEDHADALNELNMKYTVRVNDTVHSVYEAGYTGNASIAESRETTADGQYVVYDEWDCYKKIYKRSFSKVYPLRQQLLNHDYYAQTISGNGPVLVQLRKMLAAVNNKWHQQRMQPQGNQIDIDRATDRYADLMAGHTPSDNIYISDRKKEKELSLLLLLDLSLSSDSYADGNRVIDVAKQTAILFGEVLHEYGIDFSVCGFYSKTRNYTGYVTLKDFDEKWDTAKCAIGAPQPEGYTRIGPALRHSGALLVQRPARNKWVILLSDGKPNDYDRYEGKYGIGDVKQALRELNTQRVQTYALAIEAAARYYLPLMFGQDHYQVISSPAALFTTLIKLYERIRYSS